MNKNIVHKRTIKVKLNLTTDQQKVINNSITDSGIVFNLFTNLSCTHKSCSYMTLHKYGYDKAKILCPDLPTAYIQAIGKRACSAVKSWNTNNKNKQWKYKGNSYATVLPLNKLTYTRRGSLSTISTNNKRIRVLHEIPKWFINKYGVNTNNVQAGNISKTRNEFWLSLMYNVVPKDKEVQTQIIGVDRGLYNFCTLSNGTVISSKKAITIKRKYQYNRSKLQQKGTKSAKRKLKKIAGGEKRFMLDFNHVISKQLANIDNVSVYVLENLKHIRRQRKGKKINSWLSNWSYYQFQKFLEYKCLYNGMLVKYVDPRYTSQKCNQCGTVDKNNRKKGKYTCSCGYTNHSDVNAALNIRDNYALSSNRDRLFQEAKSSKD